ncbi:MAG TPA: hypothetical protein VEL74_08405 [Thermoanaerobaculia bacterium]|nr:hypothetical protein [Thermoanaerobaculia bacterium]
MISLREDYRVHVHPTTARLFLWNREHLEASFYLRPGATLGGGWEGLGERLNDPGTRFLACQIDGRVELVHLDALAYVEVTGALPEVARREMVGATRLPAALSLRCGRSLSGEFLAILPPGRRRLSDLLNCHDERFLLLVNPAVTRYVHRDAVARVIPADDPDLERDEENLV